MLTKIHPTYKSNLLAALNHYLKAKPQPSLPRIDDMSTLQRIIEGDHKDHLALMAALMRHLTAFVTGFNLFGFGRFHIQTKRSRLKQYMEAAICSIPLSVLREWDEAYQAELSRAMALVSPAPTPTSAPANNTASSIEIFLARTQAAEAENSRLKQERLALNTTLQQLVAQYGRLQVSFETLQKSHDEKSGLLDQTLDENRQLKLRARLSATQHAADMAAQEQPGAQMASSAPSEHRRQSFMFQ